MNAKGILDLVKQLEFAADQMLAWMKPGGFCCPDIPRVHGYCTRPGCISRTENYAAEWAREAGHHANRLMVLAGKGRAA